MKLVIDANILVSVFTADDVTRQLWQQKDKSHQLFISPEIFLEVESNLRQVGFHLSQDEIRLALLAIIEDCQVIRPPDSYKGTIVDLNARHLANLAKDVQADAIITGDERLLETKKLENIRIISFAQVADL